jgi:hypothetical protein
VIASLRGLVALAAAALVLAVVLVIDLVHAPAPVNHALVPGFDAERVASLRWPDVQVRRSGEAWSVCTDPAPSCQGWAADAGAVDSVVSALRGARWHRRAGSSAAGSVTRTLAVDKLEIGLGAAVEGTDQRWLVIHKAALLVDGWVARALFPDKGALIDRDVLPGIVGASRIEIGKVTIEAPCRVGGLWVDPARCDAVEQALAAVKVDTILPSAPPTDPGALTVRFRTRSGAEHAATEARTPCSSTRVALVTGSGSACVDAATWHAAFVAAAPLSGPPAAIIDRRPLPIVPVKLALPGGTLDVTAMRLDDKDADRDQVTALVAALSAPAEVAPLPAGKPSATFVATDKAGTSVTLDLVGEVLVRRGEPVALRPSREVLATITRPASALYDPTKWVEDPLVVAELVIDGVTYRRGAVVGEWTREPAGSVDPVAIEALATALSRVRAPQASAVGPIAHHVTVKLAPPVGAAATHALEIDSRCAARLDGAPVQLDPGICAALAKIRNRSAAAPH